MAFPKSELGRFYKPTDLVPHDEEDWTQQREIIKANILSATNLGSNHPDVGVTLDRIDKAFSDYYLAPDQLVADQGGFTFIVHPRDPVESDIARQFPAMHPSVMDSHAIASAFESLPPIVLGQYEGMRDISGRPLKGFVVSAPITVQGTYLNGRDGLVTAKDKVIKSANFARRKLGSEIVGLGESLGSLSKFGTVVESSRDDLKATTGHAYTVFLVGDVLMAGANQVGIRPSESTLAVVGGGGAIGSSTARLLSPFVENIILVEQGLQLQRAKNLAQELGSDRVFATDSLDSLQNADLVVSATTNPEPFITRTHIKAGAVVVDDSQPVNMSEAEAGAGDFLLLHPIGKLPDGVSRTFDFSLPEGTDFSCALELMILAATNSNKNYQDRIIGRLEDVEKIKKIAELARLAGVTTAPLQRFGQEIPYDEISSVRSVREQADRLY